MPREHTKHWLRQEKLHGKSGKWRTRTDGSPAQVGQRFRKEKRLRHVIGPNVKTRSLNHKLIVPTREGEGRKQREIKPREEKPKKQLFRIGKKPKPRTGMSHLEKMHLLSQAKELEIDSAEIDSKVNYYENKKHLETLAKEKGISEERLYGSESKVEADVASHEEYLHQLRNELEEAGYKVELPEQ